MSNVISFEQEKKKREVQDSAELKTHRSIGSERMVATLAGEDRVEGRTLTVEHVTDLSVFDRARPKITDDIVAKEEVQAAVQATGEVENEDYDKAIGTIQEQIGRTASQLKELRQEGDVLVEVLREFADKSRKHILMITGGLDTYGLRNAAGVEEAVDERRAFLVPPGTEDTIKALFREVYNTHFSGAGEQQYGDQNTDFLTPNDMLHSDIGFTIPIVQKGKETTYLYFLYGEVKEEQEQEEDEEAQETEDDSEEQEEPLKQAA